MNALGIKQEAIKAGGIPNGYKTVAANKNLTNNIDLLDNQQLNRGDICQLLYNAISGQTSTGTDVSGIIDSNATWSKANSPYIVKGNILVDEEAVLTIEPGVEVFVDGNYYIQIRGNLQACWNK